MPRRLRKPSYEEVPQHTARREFIDFMFRLHRRAGEPTLVQIAEWIADQQEELGGTASAETARRVFKARGLPKWYTVESIVLALLYMAELHPKEPVEPEDINGGPSYMEMAEMAWERAYDEESNPRPPRRSDDPWDAPF